MTEHEMDSMVDGECHMISGGVLTKLAPGTFSYSGSNGYNITGSTSSVYQAINQTITTATVGVGGNIWTTGPLGGLQAVSYPTRKSLTDEERKRLTDLEVQVKAHTKFEQVKKFKAMPRHIRQEIVDECYIRDLSTDLNQNHESSFEFAQELKDLRDKNNGYPGSYHVTAGLSSVFMGDVPHGHIGGKFASIIGKFTTDELARAHAEVCLEEDIQND